MSYGSKTQYNGEVYDSYTEASWARYFDSVGLQAVHHPNTYELFRGYLYTPDFYVDDWGSFVEVKMGKIERDSLEKICFLTSETKTPTLLIDGRPNKFQMWGCSPSSPYANFSIDPYSKEARETLPYWSSYQLNLGPESHLSVLAGSIVQALVDLEGDWAEEVTPEAEAAAKLKVLDRRYQRVKLY